MMHAGIFDNSHVLGTPESAQHITSEHVTNSHNDHTVRGTCRDVGPLTVLDDREAEVALLCSLLLMMLLGLIYVLCVRLAVCYFRFEVLRLVMFSVFGFVFSVSVFYCRLLVFGVQL